VAYINLEKQVGCRCCSFKDRLQYRAEIAVDKSVAVVESGTNTPGSRAP